MTDEAISPIVDRLRDIVGDLNQALDLARGQNVRHALAIVKTLTGDQPHYNVELIEPDAAPAEPPPPETPAGEADTTAETDQPVGLDPTPAPTVGLDWDGWCRDLEDVLAAHPDLAPAIGEAGVIPADFPEVWNDYFIRGRTPRQAMFAQLVATALRKALSPSFPPGAEVTLGGGQ